MNKTSRRKWLMGLGVGAAGAVYARVLEPRSLRVTHTPIRLRGIKSGIRVAQLSDLHSSPEVATSLLNEAAELVIQARPDVIVLTGDYITGPDEFDGPGLVRIFERLAAFAPTFSIQGNHDLTRGRTGRANSSAHVLDLLQQGNTRVLHNRTEVIEIRNQALAFTGVGDLWLDEFQPHVAFQQKVADDVPRILLCHNPDGKDATQTVPWDLMLSGHTHGGQVVLPFMEPSWVPVEDKRFVAGLYDWTDGPGNRQLFITRGVGSIRGLRFSCPPEVSILDLEGV